MKQALSTAVVLWFVTLGLLAIAAPGEGELSDGQTWEVSGVMSDACQCMVFCPCEFMSVPTFGHCDDSAILHIESGHYGEVDVSGLRVAVVSSSPEGERLVDTVGKLKFARIYVPAGADDQQAEALAAIARRIFGAFVTGATQISPDEKVERVDMDVVIEPHHHRVDIPDVLSMDIETLTGGDGKNPIVINNNPFESAGFGEVLVAHSKVYTYKNKELAIDWNYGGRSASIRSFKMGGEL